MSGALGNVPARTWYPAVGPALLPDLAADLHEVADPVALVIQLRNDVDVRATPVPCARSAAAAIRRRAGSPQAAGQFGIWRPGSASAVPAAQPITHQ